MKLITPAQCAYCTPTAPQLNPHMPRYCQECSAERQALVSVVFDCSPLTPAEVASGYVHRDRKPPPTLPIVRRPGRCSGHPTVGESRLCVHAVVCMARVYGWDLERLIEAEGEVYSRERVEAALYWFQSSRANRDEVNEIISQRDADYARGLAAQQARKASP